VLLPRVFVCLLFNATDTGQTGLTLATPPATPLPATPEPLSPLPSAPSSSITTATTMASHTTTLDFTKLPTDLKTLIVEHINRPTDLKSLCLTSKQLRDISARRLYREVTIDVGSSKDTRLGAFLNPKNIGLQHIRKLDLYLTEVLDKCNQIHQANFAVRMILELLPENILEKFSWHPWSPFSGDNLVLLYKKQKRLNWAESIAMDRNVLDELQKIPSFGEQFANVRKIGLYPDSREVLDYCHFILKNTSKLDKITLHASFDDSDVHIPDRELNDSSTGPGLITSTIFSHMQPFAKCTPLALKEITLQKLGLRYAADSYCKIIDFSTVKSIKIFSCTGTDALFAELSKSTKLPQKLETLEVKFIDNGEEDGLGAVDGFLRLVSGIKVLTLDFTNVSSLPTSAGVARHGKTLRQLSVHAQNPPDECDDELVYDYAAFSSICKDCVLLEQLSVAFPNVSVLRAKDDSFVNFEVCTFHPLNNVSCMLTPTDLPRRPPQPHNPQHHHLAHNAPGIQQTPSQDLRAPPRGSRAASLRNQHKARQTSKPQLQTRHHRVWRLRPRVRPRRQR
jgi:hypothetical protein